MAKDILDLMVGVFEHLNITSKSDVAQRVKYTELTRTGPALKKYCEIFLVCKETTNNYAGYQWTLEEARGVSMEDF